jgi:hypothetical protein
VTGWIRAHPAYRKFRYALAAAGNHCGELDDFFPVTLRPAESFPAYRARIAREVDESYDEIRRRTELLAGAFPDSKKRPALFSSAAVGSDDRRYGFSGVGHIMKYYLDLDPDLFRLTRQGSLYDSHHTIGALERQVADFDLYMMSCAELRTGSRRALGELGLP